VVQAEVAMAAAEREVAARVAARVAGDAQARATSDNVAEYEGLKRPKHHFAQHVAMDAWRYGPPRGYWCFGFEGFNKVIKKGASLSNWKSETVSIMKYWSLRSGQPSPPPPTLLLLSCCLYPTTGLKTRGRILFITDAACCCPRLLNIAFPCNLMTGSDASTRGRRRRWRGWRWSGWRRGWWRRGRRWVKAARSSRYPAAAASTTHSVRKGCLLLLFLLSTLGR